MARQRKSLETQIRNLDEQINKLQEKLDALVQQKKELLNKNRDEELKELYDFMTTNNMSIQDIYNLVGQEEHTEQQTA